ncbi:recombinase family protein [Nocardioides soli]|uniref:DNA invertase Pin-like site-specific DNA recombinase n=1 Tax=Nocardioides soli TaxID=1036020 RepID=A0A7W4Z386_9ACTN|nr:recombinase family protein [Nocardioides soli]MBB3044808.1 DNA invertase Pin-like site-specific DNA recombinase [Nocardioides soli]
MRAGIYARISLDKSGTALGVQRQEELCRERAAQRGWDVVEVYVDNDLSASSGKSRPAYERLLADLEAKKIDAVVTYAWDRITRRMAELVPFLDMQKRLGFEIANISAGDVDLSTSAGRTNALILGSIAQGEAERIGERVRAQKAQRAAMGIPHKGRHRLYGYDENWNIIEDEALIIKEAFVRRARGESITSICKDLNKRGIKTVSGNDWRSGTLSVTLTKPVYAGKIDFKGEIVADSIYSDIVDFELFTNAQTELANAKVGTNARKYLLSGILICSHCLTQMKGNPHNNMYRCAANYGGCGRISVRIKIADRWALFKAMEKHHEKPQEPISDARNYDAELDALNKKLGHVRKLAIDEILDTPSAAKEVKEIQAKINEVTKAKAKSGPKLSGPMKSYFDFYRSSLSQKRVFMGEYITNIKVGPSISRGNQPFNPARFEFFYTDGSSEVPDISQSLG